MSNPLAQPVSSMNHGAFHPDTPMQDCRRMTLQDIRAVLELAQEFIRENSYHNAVERNNELITGAVLVDELRTAESDLYLIESALKRTGYVPGERTNV